MKTLLLPFALLCCLHAYGQMAFTDTTWEAALQAARETGKPIFVDAYTQCTGSSFKTETWRTIIQIPCWWIKP